MISANVDERVLFVDQKLVSNLQSHMEHLCTNLGKVGSPRTSEVDVNQVGLGPERSKPETFHLLPPGEETGETGVFSGDCAATSAPSPRQRSDEINVLSSLSRGCNSICNCPIGRGCPTKSYLDPLGVKSMGESEADAGRGWDS